MAKTSAERVRVYRDRKKMGVTIPQCECGRLIKGALSARRLVCQRCFLDTPDGKHRAWVRMNKKRERCVVQEIIREWGLWKIGDNAITPNGSIGKVQEIIVYIDGTVCASVQFEHDTEEFLISSKKPLINH